MRTGTGRKVFVVAVAVPPVPVNPPEVAGYEADGMPGEPIYMNGGTLQVTGTNLAGATKVRFRYAEDGEPFYEADVVESTVSTERGSLRLITERARGNKARPRSRPSAARSRKYADKAQKHGPAVFSAGLVL